MVEATIEANPPHPTNPTVLRGNLTPSDGDVVLLRAQRSNLPCVIANTRRVCGNLMRLLRRDTPRNGVKNLHGSKTIPKSLYEAF